MLLTFTVSIGRNVGGSTVPLPAVAWRAFIHATTALVQDWAHALYFEGEGVGRNPYATPPTFEDSYTVVGDIFTYDVEGLFDGLAALAPRFDQRSIALTVGDTRFPGEEE